MYVALTCIFISCQEDGVNVSNCLIDRIYLDENGYYEYTTISGGQMYQAKKYVIDEGRPKLLSAYQYKFFKDSMIIRDQLNAAKFGFNPYMAVSIHEGNPVKIVRFDPASGVRVHYDIDYASDQQIIVNMTRETSDGDFLRFAYGYYDLDALGNVASYRSYRFDRDDWEQFDLTEDQFIVYDAYPNPLKGNILWYFTSLRLPGPDFFSNNNALQVEDQGVISTYGYTYGDRSYIQEQHAPKGDKIRFEYINCQSDL
jgi:hypothetical protein